MFLNKIKNKNGFSSVLFVFVLMTGLLFVVMVTNQVVVNNLRAIAMQTHSVKSFFAAESGAERILWEIRKNFINPGPAPGLNCNGTYPPGDQFCFNGDLGNIISCNLGCSGGSEFDVQTLANGATYKLLYKLEDDGTYATTTISSVGDYLGLSMRSIELSY